MVQKAAAAGDPVAMADLGALYQNGWGGPKNHMLAIQWTEKAAAAGLDFAKKNLLLLKRAN